MDGNRREDAAISPVASSKDGCRGLLWSSHIRRCIAAATTSRGARSANGCSSGMIRWPGCINQNGAFTADGFGHQGLAPRAPGPLHSTVGWNCTNSRLRSSAPARRARARPSPVAPDGLVVVAQAWPRPPVASTTARARTTPGISRPVGSTRATESPTTRPDASVKASSAMTHSSTSAPRAKHCADERPVHLGARRVAAGVDDPGAPVPSLAGESEAVRRPRVRVEDRTESTQPSDLSGCIRNQVADHARVREPCTGNERVGCVLVERVVRIKHGGEPALGQGGRSRAEESLAQEQHPATAGRRGQCCGQARRSRADHDDVRLPFPGRAVSAGSPRTSG